MQKIYLLKLNTTDEEKKDTVWQCGNGREFPQLPKDRSDFDFTISRKKVKEVTLPSARKTCPYFLHISGWKYTK